MIDGAKIGEQWWNRLVNSARYVDAVKDMVIQDQSVILAFDDEVPWQEEMIQSIKDKLGHKREFLILDDSERGCDSPGKYLMNKFLTDKETESYWPGTHKSPEAYMASKMDSLSNLYICIKGVRPENADKWVESVSKYIACCKENDGGGCVFILILKGFNREAPKYLEKLKYADYVTDYDCMVLCLTLVSNLKYNKTEKMYLCEVASNISKNDVSLAAALATYNSGELIKHPVGVTESVFEAKSIACDRLDDRVKAAVWEAQIKMVFPKLEKYRADFIKKHERGLSNCHLPGVSQVSELEIGQIYYICNGLQYKIEYSDFTVLGKMRTARNKLAHSDILNYDSLKTFLQ